MVIYGVALLAGCMIAGVFVGDILGEILHVQANVGGVGIAMLLLVLITDRLRNTGRLPKPTAQGVAFWSAIYIPIVVAMAAKQNVIAAIRGGPAAFAAGALAVLVCLVLVPVISRIGREDGGAGGTRVADIGDAPETGGHQRGAGGHP
ncbi:MAG: malonate transporter subunit MadL [Gemmatimonadetes bacterium]|nr:malonate transporter subunit MadL [Gemmatimonadota bacterium]